MCSVLTCASWRSDAQCFALPQDPEGEGLWVEFIVECNEQGSEIAEECFENMDRVVLKSCAVSTVRIKLEDRSQFGGSPQEGSFQQPGQKRSTQTLSSSNQDPEDLNKDGKCGSETLVVMVKEENIEMESEGGCSNQREAAKTKAASTYSTTYSQCKDEDEETASEEDSEWDSDEASSEASEDEVYAPVKQLCDDCGCFYRPNKSHTCEYKVKPHACNMCGKRFRTNMALKAHSHVHDNSKIYNCKFCYAPFTTKQDKFLHQETHKGELNPFKCYSCSLVFSCFLDRRKHLSTHPKAKEHKCEKCGITFTKKHVLARHMVIHSGEKPFTCSVCKRGFNQHGHLKSHMRLHTGEKPYSCQHCGKAFNHNVSLKSHIQRYHSNSRLLKTEDPCGEDDPVNGPHAEAEALRFHRWLTGRPKGRPKKNGDEKKVPKTKRSVNKPQRKRQSGEQGGELRNNNRTFEVESKRESTRSTSRLKNSDDPDYLPGQNK